MAPGIHQKAKKKSFWQKLVSWIKPAYEHVVKPVVRTVAPFIPGVGPTIEKVMDAVDPLLQRSLPKGDKGADRFLKTTTQMVPFLRKGNVGSQADMLSPRIRF